MTTTYLPPHLYASHDGIRKEQAIEHEFVRAPKKAVQKSRASPPVDASRSGPPSVFPPLLWKMQLLRQCRLNACTACTAHGACGIRGRRCESCHSLFNELHAKYHMPNRTHIDEVVWRVTCEFCFNVINEEHIWHQTWLLRSLRDWGHHNVLLKTVQNAVREDRFIAYGCLHLGMALG